MRNPSPEMLDLLTQAAELRATGLAWDIIAAQLEREPTTCRNWTSQYRDEWRRLYAEADKRLTREAGAEARVYLRKLLRSDDAKTSLVAAKLLLADRPKPRPGRRKPDNPLSRHDANLLAEVRSQSDEELDRQIRDFLADQRPSPGTAVPAGTEESQ